MISYYKSAERDLKFSLETYHDISIPMYFNGPQPNLYDSEIATAKAYEGDGFVGDTRRGGGCNFDNYKICTHLNGTHTECLGHITDERFYINQILKNKFTPSALITIDPINATDTDEKYDPALNKEDQVITKRLLQQKLNTIEQTLFKGLIIRTLLNDKSKLTRQYMSNPAPFFTNDAMQYLKEIDIQHLVLDLPSIDRMFDEGKLSNHHIFWDIPQGSHAVDENNISYKTITEMAYIDGAITDGKYLLQIHIPNFSADAAPSRPFIYPLLEQ